MLRLPLLPDPRTAQERAEALAAAREEPQIRELLEQAMAALDDALAHARANATEAVDGSVTTAMEHLDAYLAALAARAALRVSCHDGCSACCTDAPPTFAVEGWRLTRALKRRSDGPARIQRAVTYARRFQDLLRKADALRTPLDTADPRYRTVQLRFRAEGRPCPLLSDDGRCSEYARRPLACRAFTHVEDPAHCSPTHPRFLDAERPPLWGHPREAQVELRLLQLGDALGLPRTPNLPWALALLHPRG
jgi:Fe-S-cluster containining protein